MNHLGTQWTAELYGCDVGRLDDASGIADLMLAAAEVAHATIVGSQFHRFSPHGVSGVVVIAESHLAIHTWPEHAYAALDVFSCGEILRAEAAFHFLSQELRAQHVEFVRQRRGAPDRIAALRGPPRPPLHPELFQYDDAFVRRFLRDFQPREIAEQVYELDPFTPEWCSLVVEECEHHGRWVRKPQEQVDTLTFDVLPELGAVWERVVARHLRPTLERLWPEWHPDRVEASAVRREARPEDPARRVSPAGSLRLIGPLNADFSGGGIAFPRWGLTLGEGEAARPGSVIVFPSGLSHVHAERPVTAGRGYTLTTTLH